MASSPNARHKRWDELMPANKGQIDLALGEKFLADHWDTYEGKDDRNFRGFAAMVISRRLRSRRGENRHTAPWALLRRKLRTVPWQRR